MDVLKTILKVIEPFSQQYGTGDPRGDLSLVLVVILVVGALILAFVILQGARPRRHPRIPPRANSGAIPYRGDSGGAENQDRLSSLGGKLERIEMNANASRTEILREVELLKMRVEQLEARLGSQPAAATPVKESHETTKPKSHSPVEAKPEEFLDLQASKDALLFDTGVLRRGELSDASNEVASEILPPTPPVPEIPVPESLVQESRVQESRVQESRVQESRDALRETVLIPGEKVQTVRAELAIEKALERKSEKRQPRVLSENDSKGLSGGLLKTRKGLFRRIQEVFSGKPQLDPDMVEEVQAFLVSTDLGVKMVSSLTDNLREEVSRGEQLTEERLLSKIREQIRTRLESVSGTAPVIEPSRQADGPLIVVMVGVNGVGKTTTTAKLAARWKAEGAKVLLVAADTFRAAAVEQLKRWASELGVEIVAGDEGAKPSTVVFEAMERAKGGEFDVVIIDTAGRLHTKSNLMQELEGVRNIVQRHQPSAPHETLLVVDGTTGQNALHQAKEFHDSVSLTGLVVTKLDGTPKGGIVVAIQDELGVPIRFIGIGEAAEDLKAFDAEAFTNALFDTSEMTATDEPTAHGKRRRRRREEGEAEDLVGVTTLV
ncbi:MAG: signal recognition particle-docking protein FtsY [Bdellovibrionales bacterium]|nr:signal recognition particle-docking protein FtsY [Bdellovibrionales bacterium]